MQLARFSCALLLAITEKILWNGCAVLLAMAWLSRVPAQELMAMDSNLPLCVKEGLLDGLPFRHLCSMAQGPFPGEE